jgi:hypothetical protein
MLVVVRVGAFLPCAARSGCSLTESEGYQLPAQPVGVEYRRALEDRLKTVRLCVFLCGAGIARGHPPEPDEREAHLRYSVLQRLAEAECDVVLGEDGDLYRATREVLRGRLSYADHEFLFSTIAAELTVIFPCSAGSFAELGMFAVSDEIARNMVVIIDDSTEYREGYIAKGPALSAEGRKAVVKFMSYDDVEGIWEFIRGVVESEKTKKLMRQARR